MPKPSRSPIKTRLKSTASGSSIKKSSPKRSGLSQPKERNCGRIFAAIVTRILFAFHAAVALWRVSVYYSELYIYFLSIGLIGLVLETIFTVVVRKGKEYKWFCPSVLCYLLSVVPCLWLLEISRFNGVMYQATSVGICNKSSQSHQASALLLHQIFDHSKQPMTNRSKRDTSAVSLFEDPKFSGLSVKLSELLKRRKRSNRKAKELVTNTTAEGMNNEVIATTAANSHNRVLNQGVSAMPNQNAMDVPNTAKPTMVTSRAKLSTTIPTSHNKGGVNLNNLGNEINKGFSTLKHGTEEIWKKTKNVITKLDREIDLGTWILLLHQVLLFVLVIGRWLLPKGDISRDQLSQLLLVFIGVGADILEFVTETIDGDELDQTSCVVILHFLIYAVWSWSLFQFTLVLTASKSRKTRVGFENQVAIRRNRENDCCGNSIFSSADLWGILVTLFLQDVPFLATRLYILIVYNLKHQMMIFFTGKNALVVILQVYRIIVLKMKRDRVQSTFDESEMEPLHGTLKKLAGQATSTDEHGDIKGATFEKRRDGSVVVKIHLEGEEALVRKKRKGTRS